MELKQFTRMQMTEDINLNYNRTDSLQYTALIAAYKARPIGARTRYLSLSPPDVIQCAIGLHDDDADADDDDDFYSTITQYMPLQWHSPNSTTSTTTSTTIPS